MEYLENLEYLGNLVNLEDTLVRVGKTLLDEKVLHKKRTREGEIDYVTYLVHSSGNKVVGPTFGHFYKDFENFFGIHLKKKKKEEKEEEASKEAVTEERTALILTWMTMHGGKIKGVTQYGEDTMWTVVVPEFK